jgi:hypothetical protein
MQVLKDDEDAIAVLGFDANAMIANAKAPGAF